MKFSSHLTGLTDDDLLVFKNTKLTVGQLRYAIDLAILNELSDVFMDALRSQNIEIEIGTYVEGDRWQPLSNTAWFQTGVDCQVAKTNAPTYTGKIRLSVHLEFCLDAPLPSPEKISSNLAPIAQSASQPTQEAILLG